MTVPSELKGSSWTKTTARAIFPLLVWCAKNGRKITYGQLDQELQRRGSGHHVNVVMYGHPAGAVGNALLETERETGEKIPPLNALIVNARTGIPGNGCDYYLANYLSKSKRKALTPEQRKSMADDTIEEVWRYENWELIQKSYGFKPIKGDIPALANSKGVKASPVKSGWSSEPESEEHQWLKGWVAKNPKVLASTIPFGVGREEWLYASGDRVDVMFTHAKGCVAAEVKSRISNDADLERGVYQCVKYQALLRAELKASGKIPNGRSVLITERPLPQRLVELSDLLGVKCINVPRARV